MEMKKDKTLTKWKCQLTDNFIRPFDKHTTYKQPGGQPLFQQNKFQNKQNSVFFNWQHSAQFEKPLTFRTVISVNTWGPEHEVIKTPNAGENNNIFYMFGNNNDGMCYPLHGFMHNWMSHGGYNEESTEEYGGENFKYGKYRRDNNPYETVYTARTH